MTNSKVVSFLSPFKVGQAGNLWTLPRTFLHNINIFTYIYDLFSDVITVSDGNRLWNNGKIS